MSDPWSSHWSVPPGAPGFPSLPPGRYNGLSLPTTTQSNASADNKRGSSKLKMGRSVSCVTEPWGSLSTTEMGLEVGGASDLEGREAAGTDLLQLMKSLDIGSEHMQSLKVE